LSTRDEILVSLKMKIPFIIYVALGFGGLALAGIEAGNAKLDLKRVVRKDPEETKMAEIEARQDYIGRICTNRSVSRYVLATRQSDLFSPLPSTYITSGPSLISYRGETSRLTSVDEQQNWHLSNYSLLLPTKWNRGSIA
jgi:hypothetical protein